MAAAFGFDFVNGKFNVNGEGEAEVSYTDTRDITTFVAHTLTSFPKEKLEWQIFRIESERIVSKKLSSICFSLYAEAESIFSL